MVPEPVDEEGGNDEKQGAYLMGVGARRPMVPDSFCSMVGIQGSHREPN